MTRRNGHAPNGEVPTVAIALDRERHLRVDFNALAAAEEATGLNLLDQADWRRVNATRLRAIMWALLRHEDPELTLEAVGAMLTGRNAAQALAAVNEAILAAEKGNPKAGGSEHGPSPA